MPRSQHAGQCSAVSSSHRRGQVATIFSITTSAPSFCTAHASERGFILLLPTELYIAGGALIVAATSLILALRPPQAPASLNYFTYRLPVCRLISVLQLVAGTLAFLSLIGLLLAGHLGSRDPLLNPLPTVVWSLWWVGLTFAHTLFGNLWGWMNPWLVAHRLLTANRAVRRLINSRSYPTALGYWPALIAYSVFAWFELVFPAPYDPKILANVIVCYSIVTLLGMLRYGPSDWLHYADPFAVFFRLASRLSPFRVRAGTLSVGFPSFQLLDEPPLPVSGTLLLVTVLASLTFDGLARSFWWLGALGANPLEYPGRTALLSANTLGLTATIVVLVLVYFLCIQLTRTLAGLRTRQPLGALVYSLLPIAFGYHFAHYLPQFLIDAQYALHALADPLATRWRNGATTAVNASLVTHHGNVEAIWYIQVCVITGAHILAVVLSHWHFNTLNLPRTTVIKVQLPFTVLMVGYTLLGLWLLSTPVAG